MGKRKRDVKNTLICTYAFCSLVFDYVLHHHYDFFQLFRAGGEASLRAHLLCFSLPIMPITHLLKVCAVLIR